jgi:Mg2+ and Co2+ transporter CorA
MNFDVIPGLHRSYGFWLAMLGMVGVVAGMVVYFRRRRWL